MKTSLLVVFVFTIGSNICAQTNSISSSGNVGVGTTSPVVLLHLRDSSANTGTLRIGGTSYYSQLRTDAVLGGLRIINNWGGANSGIITFENGTGSTERMRIDDNGNVGVGTISPHGRLNISNSGAEGLEFGPGYNESASRVLSYNRSTASYNKLAFDGSRFEFQIEDVPKMIMDGSGNLGIGTTSPNGKLNISNTGAEGLEFGPGYNESASRILSYNRTTASFNKLAFDGSGFEFQIADIPKMMMDGSGNVGIGTTSPNGKFTISNSGTEGLEFAPGYNSNASRLLSFNRSTASYNKLALDGSGFEFQLSGVSKMTIDGSGNIGIGTTSPTEKLSVNGNIKTNGFITAKKISVTQIGWSDYVFDEDYDLKSLASVESFIRQNKRLPDVPSAKEVAERGIDVGDTQALLLKKIEELTLYIIDLKKQNDELAKTVSTIVKSRK